MIKPMLAATLEADFNTLTWPLIGSPKLDGVRCVLQDGVAYSRNLKPIRNAYVQEKLRRLPGIIDGELIIGDFTDTSCFNRTQSGVMSMGGTPDFTFWVFDTMTGPEPFGKRLRKVRDIIRTFDHPYVQEVPHELIINDDHARAYEERMLKAGFEGIMLRDPNGAYKQGRSTMREGGLIKVKRFTDGEAKVVGIEEAEENTNEGFRDELGRLKRRNTKDAKSGKGMVGVLLCQDVKSKARVRVGPGIMTHGERIMYWQEPKRLLGRLVRYRHFAYGSKDAPRFPRFHGFCQDLEAK